MRAIRVHEFGAPEVLKLEQVKEPEPGAGEVLIDVAVAGILFMDTMLRSGKHPAPPSMRLPYVPGNEVGGTVIAVGPEVEPGLIGASVVARLSPNGGYAERAVALASQLMRVPPGLGLDQAVALLANGRAALGIVREAAIVHGDRVLIGAAAGAVGNLLVQLALKAGAQVIGAARGERKLELVRGLGAEPVDYSQSDWAARMLELTSGDGLDVVLDGVGGEIGTEAFQHLRGAGRFVAFGFASGSSAQVSAGDALRRGVTIIGYGPPRVMRRPDDMAILSLEAMALAGAGELSPTIGQVFPLDQAAQAHAAIEARDAIGKLLLRP